MALTIGNGPFGPNPAGMFDVDPPKRPLLFWEPFPKRLRVVVQGKMLADSRAVIALHESGEQMRLCVPWFDIHVGDLLAAGIDDGGRVGPVRLWCSSDGKAVARSIDAPPPAAAALADHVIFNLSAVDAWYLEDDLGYAHPRDPYHRFDVQRAQRHVTVRSGDAVVAECRTPAILFETSLPPRFYLPPDAIRQTLIVKSETVTRCPYKGEAQHWHVVVDGHQVEDALWNLTTPMGDAAMIPGWFSFYPDEISVDVDGETLNA